MADIGDTQEKTMEATKTSKDADEGETKAMVAADGPDNKLVNSKDTGATRPQRQERRTRSPVVLERGVRGSVKWFSANCGYGFIRRDDTDEDVFFHTTSIVRYNTRQPLLVPDNQQVEFDVIKSPKGVEANCVSGPGGVRVGYFMDSRLMQRFNNPNRFRRHTNGNGIGGAQRSKEVLANWKSDEKGKVATTIGKEEQGTQERGKHSMSSQSHNKQKIRRRARSGGVLPYRRHRLTNSTKGAVDNGKQDDGTKLEKKETNEDETKSDGSESSEKNGNDNKKEDSEEEGEEEKKDNENELKEEEAEKKEEEAEKQDEVKKDM